MIAPTGLQNAPGALPSEHGKISYRFDHMARHGRWLCLMLSLSACSVLPQNKPPLSAPEVNQAISQRTVTLQQVNTFSLEAKLGVQYAGKGYSARLAWAHQPQSDVMQIFSPLGQQVALIERTASGIQLTDQQGKLYQASDAGQLTEQLLGWRLPLVGLSRWVLGLARNDRPFTSTPFPDGNPQQLLQDGWQIDYNDYQLTALAANGQQPPIIAPLAQQLTLQQDRVRLKLVIQQWR